jgi:hypothetical protein
MGPRGLGTNLTIKFAQGLVPYLKGSMEMMSHNISLNISFGIVNSGEGQKVCGNNLVLILNSII